jgi:hypothetical protein
LWTSQLPEHVKLVTREEPLEPKRVMSVFKERVEKHKEEIAELDEIEKLPEREPLVSYHIVITWNFEFDYNSTTIYLSFSQMWS